MSIGKAVIRPLKDALDGLPVHVRQLSEMFRRHGQRQRNNNAQVTGLDKYDEAPGEIPDYSVTPHRPADGETTGPVVFYDPKAGARPEQQAQIQAYIDGSNVARTDGYLAPNGRVSTSGQLRDDASAAAAVERAGGTYRGHAGHVPDTTWTGVADPHSWLDLDPSINQSLGGQSRRYPVGYQPTEFVYGGPYPK